MKKVDVEKLISKSMIITTVVLVVMFSMVLIQRGYFAFDKALYMPYVTLVFSILLLVVAAIFVFLGFRKNQKFFEVSAWSAGLATFMMLLKINYETKALEFNLPFGILGGRLVKFFGLAEMAFLIYLVILWGYTIYRINKDS